jgi:hypothetical protein
VEEKVAVVAVVVVVRLRWVQLKKMIGKQD